MQNNINFFHKRHAFFSVFAGLFLFGALVTNATDRYVVPPGTAGMTSGIPYNAWTNASTNIKWAVDAAVDGDTVRITNGVYALTNYISISADINLTIQSVNGPSVTIVDGNSNRCFSVSLGNKIISGLTISNGYKGDSVAGGMYVFSGNPIITNCVFTQNRSINKGGALYTDSGVNTGIIVDCMFSNNYGDNDGGMSINGGTNMTVRNCTFVNNVATGQVSDHGYGGGLGVDSSNAVVYNCLFKDNIACGAGAGGVSVFRGIVSNCTIINNIVTSNTAWGGGGGVRMRANGISVVRDCVITGNNCAINSAGSGGGGVWLGAWQANVTSALQNCLIAGNTTSNKEGGGIYVYPVDSDKTNNTAIENCTIVNNLAVIGAGGGIRIYETVSGYTNCLFVRNCIIGSNSASSSPDVYASGTNAYFYCCSPTFTSFPPNQNNTTNDPRFAGPGSGNWRLDRDSPCINTGTNRDWMTDTFDLDRKIRVRYGIVDRGAYEYIYPGTFYCVH